MKWNFNLKRFLKILTGYAVLILSLDALLAYFFDIGEPTQSIIEIIGALVIFQIIERLYHRYKSK